MSELHAVLQTINESLDNTSESLDKLRSIYLENGLGATEAAKLSLQSDLLKGGETKEKVSLLSLKNGSMISYISSLLMIVGEKLNGGNIKDLTVSEHREKTIENRVVLERGVRPLEKKLAYQLDKLTRAYTRMEKEYIGAEKRALERSQQQLKGSSDEEDEDDSSDEEELSYRPNAAGMVKSSTVKHRNNSDKATEDQHNEDEEDENDEDKNSGVYKPPKISAMLPPREQHFDDRFNAQEHKDRSNRSRMQAMEEYIRESSEQPDWESSIGANIVNHGRGGIKTLRDTEKERRITTYEEENFTRLNVGGSKIDKRKQKQRERMAKVNMIGGEDFSIFNSKRKLEDSTSRRGNKKSRSAWDRAKRRL
ncbi:hypothetical protein Kpol_541p46 [Vanderwaltozyma polyspora DSM 70294]|uniref:Uncharacterized protein n=1 Tax=Vanderwaltozyma polyspora (strain ATCC 22028 / DSM 70294 / BCRC 21397 / CBS 2163 / NBRC 10782 / NRRL Y-8283 / UCD 57-17) TaxID=436907 RepID=A7TIZ2_VANPO|nr:uncharacterized protein Kpol_541p46 [Vanderwaltozyma polyspora DSM 70294]EDO17804.1 hypothetical protein Kpol_541p46 [Vanderwaltozyma polyspora DSM 70294]